MNLENIFLHIQSFFVANPWAAILALVILALLLWKKPRQVFKLFGAILVLAAAIYLISYLTDALSIGVGKKQEITTERESRLSQ
ncbi:MAG: hypothetical protein P8X63_13285 [Desulfuromonadaceae bacterium]|jgi:hypothetical protein